jgi:hypothetical protein
MATTAMLLALGVTTVEAGAGDEPRPGDPAGADCLADLEACGWPPTGGAVDWDSARRPSGADKPYWRRNLFKRVGVDQKVLVTRWWPAEMRNPAFAAPLGAAILVAASSKEDARDLDDDVATWVENDLRGSANAPAEAFTTLGDADTAIVLVGTTYLVARLTHKDHLSETTSLVAEALIDSGIWNTVLKSLTSRARPNETPSSRLFNDQASSSGYSFPSGHAMGAFAAAAVISGQYRQKKWVPWVAYGWATLTAASRVALGRHYVSDVVAGAALGDSIGRMVVVRAHGELPERTQRWSPIVDPVTGGYGIAYSRSW